MNNFVKRTLSGILFVTLIVGSILLSRFTFAVVFAIICGLSVREFHRLTNIQSNIVVNQWIAFFGGILLFLNTYLFKSGILPYTVFSVYGLYVVLVLVFELYRQKINPLHNWAYFILGQVFV